MKKLLTLLSLFLLSGFMLHAQETVTIGNGTESNRGPLSGYYGYERNLLLYRSNELQMGQILSIAFQAPNNSRDNIPAKIYFKEVTWNNIPDASELVWNQLISGATLVYQGTPNIVVGTGWFSLPTILNNFVYTGTGNLLVLIATNKGGSGGSSVSYNHDIEGNTNNVIHTTWKNDYDAPDEDISFADNDGYVTGEEYFYDFWAPNIRWNTQFVIQPVSSTCPFVTNLAVSNISHYNATVTWTRGGTETQWLLSYKKTSEPAWSNWIPVSGTPSYSFTATPLSSGTDYLVRVRALCTQGDTSGARQTTFTTPIACHAPSNLAAISATIGASEATVNWRRPSSAPVTSYVDYTVEYKTSTAEWSAANRITNVTDTFIRITGLSGSMLYSVRVRVNCAGDDNSTWITANFRTACGIITSFPWFEGFEEAWVPATGAGNKPAPPCWTVVDKGTAGSQYYWQRTTDASFIRTGTGAAKCYTDYGTNDHNDWLITPTLALTGNERLRFWARRSNQYTSEPDEISIFVSNENITLTTAGMGTYDTMPGFHRIFRQLLPEGNWQRYEINLSQYSGYRYIAFVRQGTPDGYNLCLDDISIEPLPSCNPPHTITISNITQTSANINFLPGLLTDNAWRLYYKTSTATTWNYVDVSSSPFLLNPLVEGTTYQFYLKTNCGTGFSDSVNTYTFTTPLTPASIPFEEHFETPTAWQLLNGTQTNKWVIGADANANNNGGTKCLYVTDNATATPPPYQYDTDVSCYAYAVKYLLFEETGNYIISYDWKADAEAGFDYMQVWLAPAGAQITAASAPNTTGWINLYGTAALSQQPSWQTKSQSFHITGTGIYQLVFYWRNDGSLGTQPPGAIDNIIVGKECNSVTNLRATEEVGRVTLTWTAPATTPAGYEIRFDGALLVSLPATATTYTHTPAPSGTHIYAVKAVYNNCFSQSLTVVTGVQAYAGNIGTSKYGYVNLANGALTPVGNIIGNFYIFPMSEEFDGTNIYRIYDDNAIGVVNGGVYTQLGTITGHSGMPLSISYDWGAHQMYLLTADEDMNENEFSILYRLNMTTFQATLVGTVNRGGVIISIDMSHDGYFYGPSLNDGNLYRIDKNTAIATLVGSTGLALNYGQDVSFDPETQRLYTYTCSNASRDKAYGYYDLSTGAFHSITPISDQYATFVILKEPGDICEPVTNLNAALNEHTVTLTWTAPASTPTAYEISFNGTFLASLPPTATTYTHTPVPTGIHTYTVKAQFGNTCYPVAVNTQITVGSLCSLMINMYDDYGDGWDCSGRIDIIQNGTVVARARLSNGYFGTATVVIPAGESQFVWVSGCNEDENSFTIISGGETIYTSDYVTAGPFFTWTCGTVECNRVTDLTATISPAACRNVLVEWTPGANDRYWELQLKKVGDATFINRPIHDAPIDNLTGLEANANYLIRVRANCSTTTFSDWDSVQVRTNCGPYTITPTVAPAGKGTIDPAAPVTVNTGDNQMFTFTPTGICTVERVLVDNAEVEYTHVGNGGTYRFNNVTDNHTIHVVFAGDCEPGSIEENEPNEGINLYPNPAHHLIYVETTTLYKKVEVIDIIGKVVYSGNIEDMKFEFDVSTYASGIYLVKLQGDQRVITKKFIKE